jgi:hypothetical protein
MALRKWKLLKDTLWGSQILPAGTMFSEEPSGRAYSHGEFRLLFLETEFVQKHPEWFEEVKRKYVLVVEVPNWLPEDNPPDEITLHCRYSGIHDHSRTTISSFSARVEEREG